jgi:hypothetical protein
MDTASVPRSALGPRPMFFQHAESSVVDACRISLLLFCIGCSATPVPSGFVDENADPIVLFRCEEGRVAAYISVNAEQQTESDSLPDGAVPVQLDSSLSCKAD